MGTIKELNCKSCGSSSYLYQGVGMLATYLLCDKCGDQHVLDYPVIEPEQVPKINCECGGTYGMELNFPLVCPECGNGKIDVNDVGLWD